MPTCPEADTMKHRLTLANVDKLQTAVDNTAKLHRLGLTLYVLACATASLAPSEVPDWARVIGLAAAMLAFGLKGTAALLETRVVKILGRVMGMPYRRDFKAMGHDRIAWSSIRSYALVSVTLALAAALTPSMMAALGDTPYVRLTLMLTTAAMVIQSFDMPRRLNGSIMQICCGRLDVHACDGERMVA